LPLAQTIAQPQGSNGIRQIQMPVAVAVHADRQNFRYGCYDFRLLLIQRQVASPAEIIGCAELDQQAAIATNNLP
jgi:hypothetical protein